jgi:hypothetical protein
MASTIGPKALVRAQALAQAWVGPPDFLLGSACWRSPDWDRLSQLAGWRQRQLARQLELRREVSSVLSQRRAFRRKTLTPTLRAFAVEALLFPLA